MTVSPGVRAPRAWLQVLGAYLPTAEIEATVNTKKSSGTYSAVIPMDTATQMGIDLYTLSDEPTITASVFINQDANTSGPVNLISGPLDEIEFDFERQILQFKGRDQSSGLHDTKNHEKFLNQTASQIVTTIAGRHGLTPQIDDTTGMVGRALRQDFAKLTDGMSDWSLVQKLAEIEGASCYVKGSTLVFTTKQGNSQYQVTYTPPTAQMYATGNFIRLTVHRNLQAGKSIQVKTSSWDAKKKQPVTSVKTLEGSGGSIIYEYRGANVRQEQADKHSEKKAKEHGRHEMQVNVDMPGDTSIDASMQLVLSGTQTQFDQAYEIDTIHHRCNDSGYRMSIEAKSAKVGRNVSSQSGGGA